MALSDAVSNILLRVKADTSDAKAELRSLRGVERQAAQDRLAELEKQNRGIDAQIAAWGRVAVAVGAGVAAFKLAQNAAKAYLEDVRLESAAAGANINALREATNGLIETDQLLAFAGKAQAGVWKLNQQEMETVLRGATALRKTMGVELQPTIDALADSLAKGSTRALKEFGIEAESKQDALRQLDGLFKGLGGNVTLAGDGMQRTGVQMADAFDDIQGGLGELVMELEPAIKALGEFVGLLVKGAQAGGRFTDWLIGVDTQGGSNEDQRRRRLLELQKEAREARTAASSPFASASARAEADRLEMEAKNFERWINKKSTQAAERAADSFVDTFTTNLLFSNKYSKTNRQFWGVLGGIRTPGKKTGGGGEYTVAGMQDLGDYGAVGGNSLEADMEAMAGSIDDSGLDDLIAEWQKERKGSAPEKRGPTILEQVFGTPEQISAQVEAIKLATSAFDGFTQAAASGFDAMITGSESFGSAFTKAIADAIRVLAGQMFVESLKHAAFAVGSLAFGNIPAAATHGKAAALFAAGAAAAGVVAHEMGQATGQWAAGGGGGGGGTSYAGGGGGPARTINDSEDQRPVVIYVGAEWAALSKVEQANAISNALRLGRRGSNAIRRG